MNPMTRILDTAIRLNRKIVLSEGEDPRVVAAAVEARRQGVARVVLVGDRAAIALAGTVRLNLVEASRLYL